MKAPAPGIIPCCLVAKTGQKALTLNTGTIIITSALPYEDGKPNHGSASACFTSTRQQEAMAVRSLESSR
jgi:hypothetical protein